MNNTMGQSSLQVPGPMVQVDRDAIYSAGVQFGDNDANIGPV